MPIKSFRGQIVDGGQDTILLHTNNGSTGYRVVKFQIFPVKPGGTNHVENVVQIWKEEQATVPTTNPDVDFSDNRLLGAAYLTYDVNLESGPDSIVIFDKEIFNQDIYVNHKDVN